MTQQPNQVWTEDMDKQLEELLNEGVKFTDIAHKFGVTKNSVASRARRKGLRSANPHMKRNKLMEYAALREQDVAVTPQRPRELRDGDYDPFFVPHGVEGVSLLDVTGCRYPVHVTPYVFCNKPKRHKSSYCDAHSALCGQLYRRS